jgi:hypothetical protein
LPVSTIFPKEPLIFYTSVFNDEPWNDRPFSANLRTFPISRM